jgi:beta-galactosidase
MQMKTLLPLLVSLLLVQASAQTRITDNLNDSWLFKKGKIDNGFRVDLVESGFEKVSLPHTYNVSDSFDDRIGDDSLDITYYYYRGPAWYRKRVFIGDGDRDKRLILHFEGANAVSKVWINQKYVGEHVGGYSEFQFDITDFVEYNKTNLIAVEVDNSYNYDVPPHRADYTMYGGIYRDVYLQKLNATYLGHSLITVKNPSTKSASVSIDLSVAEHSGNQGKYNVIWRVLGPHNEKALESTTVVSTKGGKNNYSIDVGNILNPQLWSPDSPSLYTLSIELHRDGKLVDATHSKFGVRWFRFDANEGFFLNDTYLKLHGVNRHQDRQGFGNALSNAQHREDMQMIKDVGANYVRLAHYQQDPAVLDACDSLGLLAWEEIPVVTSIGREKFKENALNMLSEMITQHYNHPSIIIWGLMNETVRTQPDNELHFNVELCRALNQRAKQLDPYRSTAQAQMSSRGEDILQYTDLRAWNRYFGWYYGAFADFGTFMDQQKKEHPDQAFIISEYGADSKLGFHKELSTTADYTENWQLEFHKSHWKQILERKWIAGSTVWIMFDFASDEKSGNNQHINQKGLVSFDRKPKDLFYFYQSEWSSKPMIYIVSHTWKERKGLKNVPMKLELFSNCDKAEVTLNGQTLPTKTGKPFLWDVFYREGTNTIEAVGYKGNVKVVDSLEINFSYVKSLKTGS